MVNMYQNRCGCTDAAIVWVTLIFATSTTVCGAVSVDSNDNLLPEEEVGDVGA